MEETKRYNIGYVRVSTQEQNEARQLEIMNKYGVKKIFAEKISGKTTNRPKLQEMLNYVREGDAVVVESFSRLARNTRDLLFIVDKLKEKGVSIVSDKEQIDTTKPEGRFMMTVFSGLVQFELEQRAQRQTEGIAIAKAEDAELKARGLEAKHYKGRQRIDTNADQMREVCKAWRDKEITAREAMQRLDMKPNTFYRRVKELGI